MLPLEIAASTFFRKVAIGSLDEVLDELVLVLEVVEEGLWL